MMSGAIMVRIVEIITATPATPVACAEVRLSSSLSFFLLVDDSVSTSTCRDNIIIVSVYGLWLLQALFDPWKGNFNFVWKNCILTSIQEAHIRVAWQGSVAAYMIQYQASCLLIINTHCLLQKTIVNKKQSENADTSTSVTFDLELWPWPLVKVK